MIAEAILPKIKPGAMVRVWEKVKDGDKFRSSKFEGLVLARKHGSEKGATFTVRTVLSGIGVEKVYPIYSPRIEKVEVLNSPRKVKRAKLYFVRDLSKKEIRRKLGAGAEKTLALPEIQKAEAVAAAPAEKNPPPRHGGF